MKKTLEKNSYHILGLDTSASQRDALKRSKEIINRLKIDDPPEYDLDLDIFDGFRTEESVREAVQNLSSPRKKIKEYFFWFQIADRVDEQAADLLKSKDYAEASRTWENNAEKNTAKSLLYKKNLAILHCLLLFKKNSKINLTQSLKLWREIVDSDKFWGAFAKVYKLHDELGTSQEIIDEFKSNAISYVADIYTELGHFHNDNAYVAESSEILGAKGAAAERTVLNPIYQNVVEVVEKLEAMKLSEDLTLDKQESETIKKLIKQAQDGFNKLVDLGLYDDSQSKTVRDRFSNAIRTLVLDLHNNLDEVDLSLKLMNIAVQVSGTAGLKNKLSQELEQIKKNKEVPSSLSIEIPGMFGGGTVIFRNTFVEYRGKRIAYRDVTKVSYHSVRQSINLIPTAQTYTFMLGSDNEKISFSFSSAFYIGNKEKQDTFVKLISLSKTLIEPLLVKKFASEIFDRDGIVNIGGVEFSKNGYCRKKFFGGQECVPWDESVYVPQYDSGDTVLMKHEGDKAREFTRISMSTDNSVILPELITECANRAIQHGK